MEKLEKQPIVAPQTEIQIRPLKTLDFFKISKILAKVGTKAVQDLREGMSEMQAGLLIFAAALQSAEDETMEWLADVANIPPAQFKEMEMDTPLIVIEKLIEQEDMKRFFARVKALTMKFLRKQ